MFYSMPDEAKKSKMKISTFTTLSCLHIVNGVFLITCYICVVGPYDFGGSFGNSLIHEALWCGVFFLIFGVTGCFLCRRTFPCTVILMNIFGSLFAIVVMVTAGLSVYQAPKDDETQYMHDHYLGYPQDLHEDLVAYLQTDDFNCTERTIEKYKYSNTDAHLYHAVLSPFITYDYKHLSKYVLNLNFNGSIYSSGHMVPVKNVSLKETTSIDFLMDVDLSLIHI